MRELLRAFRIQIGLRGICSRSLSFESTPNPFVNLRYNLEMMNDYVNRRMEWRPAYPAARVSIAVILLSAFAQR